MHSEAPSYCHCGPCGGRGLALHPTLGCSRARGAPWRAVTYSAAWASLSWMVRRGVTAIPLDSKESSHHAFSAHTLHELVTGCQPHLSKSGSDWSPSWGLADPVATAPPRTGQFPGVVKDAPAGEAFMHKRTVQSPHPPAFFTRFWALPTCPPHRVPADQESPCVHCGVSAWPILSPCLLPHLLLPGNSNQGLATSPTSARRILAAYLRIGCQQQSRDAWQRQTEVPTDLPDLLRAAPGCFCRVGLPEPAAGAGPSQPWSWSL